jgi:hypothetical protein
MSLRRTASGLALLGALVVAVPAIAKDLVLQRKITTLPGPKPTEQTEYYTARKTITDGPAERTLVDLDAKTITTLDKTKKTYWVITFAEMKRDLALQRDARRKQLAELPKEVRDLMRLDQKPTVTRAEGRQTIAGYAAREYRVEAGPVSGTVWTTEDLALPDSIQEWRALSAGEGQTPVGGLSEALAQVNGFPLKTVTAIGSGEDTQTVTDEVLSVRQESPPAELLTVPADWKKVARPEAPPEPEEEDDDEDDAEQPQPTVTTTQPTPTTTPPATAPTK